MVSTSCYFLKLLNAPDEESFVQLLDSDEYDVRFECGISQPIATIRLAHRDEIINGLALHSFLCVKAELDQILSGLSTYKIAEFLQRDPYVTRQLFVNYRNPLSADKMFDLFPAKLSPVGSNVREVEEAAVMQWVNYTQAVEGKLLYVYIHEACVHRLL